MAEPVVGVIMGSRSDWETMQHACATLDELGVPYETRVVSAHRTPELMAEYASGAVDRGSRRRGASSRHDGRAYTSPGARSSGRVARAQGDGLAAVDRADACRRP